jgi:hypothetical protein
MYDGWVNVFHEEWLLINAGRNGIRPECEAESQVQPRWIIVCMNDAFVLQAPAPVQAPLRRREFSGEQRCNRQKPRPIGGIAKLSTDGSQLSG